MSAQILTRAGVQRAWPVLAASTLILALVAPPANASYNSTAVPQHPVAEVGLSLLGGSADGYAVQMLKPATSSYGIYTGAPGDKLVERTLPVAADRQGEIDYLGVVGQHLGYTADIPGNPTRYEMHRLNVVTGVDTALGTVNVRPLAFTSDSWLGLADGYVVATRFDTGTAARLARVGTQPWDFRLTTDGVLIESTNPAHTEYYLDLVTFGSTTVERVATEPSILNYAISPTTITWYTNQTVGEPQIIKVRDRSGGNVFTYSESDDYADPVQKVAGYHSAGFLYARDGVWRLRTISTSGTVNTIVVPDDSDGLRADGQRWLMGTGGRAAEAGVYEVLNASQNSTPTRVASVTPPNAPVYGLSFSAGRIYYADQSVYEDVNSPLELPGPLPVYWRPVTGLGAPTLGTETELEQRTSFIPGDPTRTMEFSAGRGVVSGEVTGSSYTWRLLDRGRTTATVRQNYSYQPTGDPDTRYPNLSGPYLTAAGHVFDAAGKLVYSRPGAAAGQIGAFSGTDDLYGPRLIYSRAAKQVGYSDIWLRDLDRAKSKNNPGKLASVKDSSPLVAIWGNTAAWQSGARQISLRTLGSAKVRTIKITGPLIELTMGEGTLAWNANAKTYLLDTTRATSTPIAYASPGRTIRLDDHYLARRVSTGAAVVYYTGIVAKYRPRLIAPFAPSGFTPNGDGKADTWAPQFDLTKPVKDVKLIIRSPRTGSTLRTLTGTGADGSVRDLVFDGRSSGGTKLASGTYGWQLTANAQDGEGAAIGIRGESRISGTVKVVS